MAEAILKQCILRLRSADILSTIRKWSYLGPEDLKQLEETQSFKKTKRDLTIRILEHCQVM